MAQFKHYINIIERFEQFKDDHLQLKFFGQGDIWETNAFPTMTFPALWVNTVSAVPKLQLTSNNIQTIEYTFNIICMDAVKKGEENELNVLNDTQLILIDLIKDMKANWDDFDMLSEPELVPFTERFSDWLSGWNLRIVVTVDFASNYCEIAINPNPYTA